MSAYKFQKTGTQTGRHVILFTVDTETGKLFFPPISQHVKTSSLDLRMMSKNHVGQWDTSRCRHPLLAPMLLGVVATRATANSIFV